MMPSPPTLIGDWIGGCPFVSQSRLGASGPWSGERPVRRALPLNWRQRGAPLCRQRLLARIRCAACARLGARQKPRESHDERGSWLTSREATEGDYSATRTRTGGEQGL